MHYLKIVIEVPDSVFDEDAKGDLPNFNRLLEKIEKVCKEEGSQIISSDF